MMGAFGVIAGMLHYLGLYIQLGVSTARQSGQQNPQWENRISANALFTEIPHDVITRAGQDVEMACSFRGVGSPAYSLEIQWWYVRNHKDWTDKQTWASNQLAAAQQEEPGKDATKISVVKVVGSNISHKLRLSAVKPSDEGTYECRVIDFSDGKARHHKVKAYLRVEPNAGKEKSYQGIHTHRQEMKMTDGNGESHESENDKLGNAVNHHKASWDPKGNLVNADCADNCVP
ncbi:V-set and transmembrane domain-containing protein 2-like protein [Protopterus annectens]|uniref:V-set and transmembrane domain-containing protein 2-like protein n=1 Tax=Protopterus annectens TaxID=7888 RepID=UPI001CFBAC51|nr:V-set and transmembrane domain-containing protein 2-like protein [Protopterus annectens]